DIAPIAPPRIVAAPSTPPVFMGSAAPANLHEEIPEETIRRDVASNVPVDSAPVPEVLPEPQPLPVQMPSVADPIDRLQSAVLQALTDGNQRILVSMLEAGEWSVQGNEVVIKIAESQTVVDMSFGPDAKRLAIASASGVLGRAVKLKIVP